MHSNDSADARAQPATPPYEISFSRQFVVDRDGMLCAFVLVPRVVATAAAEPEPEPEEPAAADDGDGDGEKPKKPRKTSPKARALVSAIGHPDLRAALVGHFAYIELTRELLFDDVLLRLLPQRVGFELPLDIGVDEDVLARVATLAGRRYRFMLTHIASEPDETFAALLQHAEGVKVDIRTVPPALVQTVASAVRTAGRLRVAEGVDSPDDFARLYGAGFQRFQGYFFTQPHTGIGARQTSAPRQALLGLLQLLGSEPTVAQLETELKRNPVVEMHMMRLANARSARVGRKIETLREAINATGTDRIARWTQLLLYADGRKIAPEHDPLLQIAATRARFMELGADEVPSIGLEEEEAVFLVGALSLVDIVFGGAVEHTLDMLKLARPLRVAILRRAGPLGHLLDAIEALERADWERLDAASDELGLSSARLAELALAAAEWAGMAERNSEAAGLEHIED